MDRRSRLSQNKKDIYNAKGQGFDVKILREVIRIPKKFQKDRTRRSLCSTFTFSPQDRRSCLRSLDELLARTQRLDLEPSASQLDRGASA
ncbi:MAG: GapR family DNA-binding domain-containing protein [Microvirga sp.]